MSIPLIRYRPATASDHGAARWGVLFDRLIAPLPGEYATTSEVVREGSMAATALSVADACVPLETARVLSPVTGNQQFLCQGINYESHVRESGLDPADLSFNTIFNKASSCLSGPYDDVVRPPHVRLLDYEIELGLVLGRDLGAGNVVHEDRLHEVLAGVTIINDVSARDVQLPQGQFYKGKSYRTFGPAGPLLLLLEPEEWRRWPELHMRLTVNGLIRQDAYCREMLYRPHQTLTELSAMHDVRAGDLVATGTPAGCAAKAPGRLAMFVMRHFVSESAKWRLFVRAAQRNPSYLQPGDMLELEIRTDDGELDLGRQCTRVVAGA
jgi:2-keto-4-pentenoate hydratase/2-oxohepta-3-ene-1,7-dioic acid hydratase in catechol pathway